MARGVPVACSDRSSLPEVAGDAALLFDPSDTAAIGVAIERCSPTSRCASAWPCCGRERAAAFTWERTAAGTVAAYERALSQRRVGRPRSTSALYECAGCPNRL